MDVTAAVREQASHRVAERLKVPDDLQSLDQYRRECLRKMESAQARLKQIVQTRLEDVKRGLELLEQTAAGVQEIKGDIAEAEVAYRACQSLSDHVHEASRLTQERNELKVTMEHLDQVFDVPETVQIVKQLFEEEPPDLLEVHERMSGMEVARDHLLAQLAQQTQKKRGSLSAVNTYFSGLVDCEKLLLEAFEPAYDPINLVRHSPEQLVTVLRIIEREERREAETTTKSASMLTKLKALYYQEVEKVIQQRFNEYLGGAEDVDAFLHGFDSFYFEDLLTAMDDLPSRFPPGEEIFQFFLSQYHSRLCLMTDEMWANTEKIDPAEIMVLLNWVPVYNNEVNIRLGVDPASLGQQLLGVGEDELRSEYLAKMAQKLQGWCSNLVQMEAKSWFEESEEEEEGPPDTTDGMYITDAPVILFQIIDQQVDVAFQPGGNDEFADKLLKQCFTTMKGFHAEYIASLMQVRNRMDSNQEQVTYLPEYMMAAVNNNKQASKFLEQVKRKIEDNLEEGSQREERILREINSISLGFDQVANYACNILVRMVFTDLAEVLTGLFNQHWMRSNKAIETVFATLNDYGGDFEEHVARNYFESIMTQCQHELLVAYVQAMVKKKVNVRSEDDREVLISRLEEETNMMRRTFDKFGVGGEDRQGREPIKVLVYIRQLMEANRSMIAVSWQKLRAEYPDVTLHHLEALLTIREDFQTKEARQYIRQLVKKEAKQADDLCEDNAQVSTPLMVEFFGRISVNTSANYTGKGKDKDKEERE